MGKRKTIDLLKTVTGLKWRIIYKESRSCQHLITFLMLHGQMGKQPSLQQLLGNQRVLPRPLLGQTGSARLQGSCSWFPQHVESFNKNSRAVTNCEEVHATQRAIKGVGFKPKAHLFTLHVLDPNLNLSCHCYRKGIRIPKHIFPIYFDEKNKQNIYLEFRDIKLNLYTYIHYSIHISTIKWYNNVWYHRNDKFVNILRRLVRPRGANGSVWFLK